MRRFNNLGKDGYIYQAAYLNCSHSWIVDSTTIEEVAYFDGELTL
jgi:hypothetical protein